MSINVINFINVYISFMPIQFRPTPICLFSVDISIWVHTNHTFTSHHGTNFSKYFLYLKFPQLREEVFHFKTRSLPLRRFFFIIYYYQSKKAKIQLGIEEHIYFTLLSILSPLWLTEDVFFLQWVTEVWKI